MSSSPRKQPAPGARLSDAGRQYSQASSTALKKLNSLDAKVEGISGRVENVVSSLSSAVVEAEDATPLLKAKNELAQIMGDLEKLQFREVDAVDTSVLNSGKDEARLHRKQLNAAIDGLLRRTQSLYNDFNSLAEQVKAGKILPPKRRRNDAQPSSLAPAATGQPGPQRGGRIKIPIGGTPIVEPPVPPEPVTTGKIKIIIQDGSTTSAPDNTTTAAATTSTNAGSGKAPTPKGGRRTPRSTPKAADPAPVAPAAITSEGASVETPKSIAADAGSTPAPEGQTSDSKGPRLSRDEFLERRRRQRQLARQRKAQARAEKKAAEGLAPSGETEDDAEGGENKEEEGDVQGEAFGAPDEVKQTRPKGRKFGKRRGYVPKKDANSANENDGAADGGADAAPAPGPSKRELTPEEIEKRRERRRLARQRKAARAATAAAPANASAPAAEAS